MLPPIANTRKISWNTSYRFPYPCDLAAAEKYVLRSMNCHPPEAWSHTVILEDMLIGGSKIWRSEDIQAHTAEIGYWLGEDYWGKGLATEIITALVDHITATSDLELLTANCFGWNPASGRVLEKCGFRKVGVLSNGVRKWGKTTDLHIWERLLR